MPQRMEATPKCLAVQSAPRAAHPSGNSRREPAMQALACARGAERTTNRLRRGHFVLFKPRPEHALPSHGPTRPPTGARRRAERAQHTRGRPEPLCEEPCPAGWPEESPGT